jgi:pimeloyl-ACP methyl ester carboxylesterase
MYHLYVFRRRSVRVNGRRVAFWENSGDAARTIVMLHGLRGNHIGLMGVALHLQDYRVILPDRPGYGESEPLSIPHTIQNYSLWLDDFVAAIQLEEFATWGHSSGASIILTHAVIGTRRPYAVVNVTPAATRRDPLMWFPTAYYCSSLVLPSAWRRRWLTSRTIDKLSDRFIFVNSDQRSNWQNQRDADRPTLRQNVIREEFFSTTRMNLLQYAAEVDVPTLLVGGLADVVAPPRGIRRLAAVMHSPLLILLPDAGHLMPIEEPALVARITRDYIRDLNSHRPQI